MNKLNIIKKLPLKLVTGIVVDVGPGEYFPGVEFLKHSQAITVIGINYNPREIKLAHQRFNLRTDVHKIHYNHSYTLSNLYSKLYPTLAEVVISYGSFHQWTHPLNKIKQISNLTKPGGIIVLGNVRKNISWSQRFKLQFNIIKLKQLYKQVKQGPDLEFMANLFNGLDLKPYHIIQQDLNYWLVYKKPLTTASDLNEN